MTDIFERLETLQADIDTLQPGAVRDELQSDLSLVAAIIERLPHRINDAMSWETAYKVGARKARDKLHEAFCAAWAPPPKPTSH